VGYIILGIKSYFYKDKIIVISYCCNGKGQYLKKVKNCKDYLLERLRKRHVHLSIFKSCCILLNINIKKTSQLRQS